MRYRKLDENGDMTFGLQQSNFYRDTPEAPAQAILTRLRLFLGEWYLDISKGVPYQGGVLGKYTDKSADPTIRDTILKTFGVSGIVSYESSYNAETRVFSVRGVADTIYGQIPFAGVF